MPPLSRPRLTGVRRSSAACGTDAGSCEVLEVVAMRNLLSLQLCIRRYGSAACQLQHRFFSCFFNREFTGDPEVVQDDDTIANAE